MDGKSLNKKIGIVTIFNVLNYGAVLQGFALYKTIEKLGLEPYMINYVPKRLMVKTSQHIYNRELSIYANIKGFIKRFLFGIGYGKEKSFRSFLRNNERITRNTDVIDDVFLNDEFRTVVVGSDQVWNPEYTDGRIDENFVLSNVHKTKKISFSSSLGSMVMSDEAKEALRYSLSSFDAISVREASANKFLTGLGVKNIETTCDPTFLLERTAWSCLIGDSDVRACPKKSYLLIYTFDHDPRCFDAAKNIAEKLDLDVVSISSLISKPRFVKKQYTSLSPSGFLALFALCSYVVTNSFHGTCFSLIFGKDFTTINKTNNPIRLQNLLSDLGLSSRLCFDPSVLNVNNLKVDYEAIDKKITIIRNNAIEYLKKNL